MFQPDVENWYSYESWGLEEFIGTIHDGPGEIWWKSFFITTFTSDSGNMENEHILVIRFDRDGVAENEYTRTKYKAIYSDCSCCCIKQVDNCTNSSVKSAVRWLRSQACLVWTRLWQGPKNRVHKIQDTYSGVSQSIYHISEI